MKSTIGLPMGVRLFPSDSHYAFNRVEIETKAKLSPEQETKLFKILESWFLKLKKEV